MSRLTVSSCARCRSQSRRWSRRCRGKPLSARLTMRSMPALARTRRLSRPMAPASTSRPMGQPAAAPTGSGGNRTEGRVRVSAGAGAQGRVQVTAGSLANGLQGGNGAPPGTRLIDMPVIPLPPGSGMPPIGETWLSSDELVAQFASGTTPQQIGSIVQRFGLTIVAQETIGILGRTVYTFRIANGQSVREVIRRVEAAGLPVAVQPKYAYRLAQDRNNPNADLGDPAQY